MNLKQNILFVVLSMTLASCVQTQEAVSYHDGQVVTLTAPDGQTKTMLGDVDGYKVPVYWSQGDRINVNGVTSSPLNVGDGQRLSKAEFLLNNVALPYTVIYPAEIYSGLNQEGKLVLEIPQQQDYVPGSFAQGADILFGTSSEEGPVVMNHLCGTVKLSLTDEEGSIVEKLTLTSLSEGCPLSGTFVLDAETSTLTCEEGFNSIQMALPEGGIVLGSETTDFYLTIPAGKYPDGFEIKLEDSRKYILRLNWLREEAGAQPGVTVNAGQLVQFSTQEYDPDAREICSAEDWELFAAAYNAGGEDWKKDWLGKDGVIRLGADITAKSLTRIVSLSHDIDGCGYSITQSAGSTPLIGTNRATVSNLTMKGKMIPADPFNAGAVVFTTTLGAAGKFINCHNEMDIVVNALENSDVVAGAFVRSMQGGVIRNCTNKGNISVYSNISKVKDQRGLAGGFVAIVRDLTGPALIENCVNDGNVSFVMGKTATLAGNRPINAGYAGIVANVTYGTADTYLTVKDCVNNGDVSVSYTPDPTGAQALVSGAGGIVGLSTKLSSTGGGYASASGDSYYLVLEGCVNNGNIANRLVCSSGSAELNKSFSGGVAGVIHGIKASHAQIIDCENYGKVECYEGAYSRAALCVSCGGLLGCGAFVDMKDCIVNSPSVGTLKRQSYSVSAGVGILHQTFTMTGCKFFANLNIIRSTKFAEKNWSLGFSLSTSSADGNTSGASLAGSSVTGCSFGGTLTTNKELVEYNSTATTFGAMETTTFTASDFGDHIASKSYGKGEVTFENNSYWNGL